MANDRITASQILLPVLLLTVVLLSLLGYQTKLLWGDRTGLHYQHDQQDKPLEQLTKVKAQVNALAVGTLQLSKQGNKDAENIIAQLKKAGIDVNDQGQSTPAPGAPAPTAPAVTGTP
jgi:hypothetical protein